MTFKIEKTPDEWKALLKAKNAEALAFDVTRQATERPFQRATGRQQGERHVYRCICCDKPLFSSEAKFDSGCGWPSYFRPLSADGCGTHAYGPHAWHDPHRGALRQIAGPIWATCLRTAPPIPACGSA
jgi:peptide-methionine (R)-S-oxide reductase